MKIKNTFYNWLTNRYIVIVRNEENFSVKSTFSINYAKVIVFIILLFSLCSVLSFSLIRTALSRWYNPEYAQLQAKRQVLKLSSRVDSLTLEVQVKDNYIENIKSIITGDIAAKEAETIKPGKKNTSEGVEKVSPVDSIIRSRFETRSSVSENFKENNRKLSNINFFAPVDGVITSPFNVKNGNFGVKVLAPENEPVKAVANGTILDAFRTEEKGIAVILQHDDGLISVYQNMRDSDKQAGANIGPGEVVGYTGNNSEDGNIYFQLWYKGLPVDPENFVSF